MYGHKMKQCILYLRPIRSSDSIEGALEEAGRAEQHIITKAGHQQGVGVGGCSSGVVFENQLVGSKFSVGMRTHNTFRISAGEAFRRQAST